MPGCEPMGQKPDERAPESGRQSLECSPGPEEVCHDFAWRAGGLGMGRKEDLRNTSLV